MKILKLFAGIGGDRTYYPEYNWYNQEKNEITAIEHNWGIGDVYGRRFPDDHVYIEDAYAFLVKNFQKFDCITASPPCQSHSQCNSFRSAKVLPDMRLYSIIVFLKQHFKGAWYVENVRPWYFGQIDDFLIKPSSAYNRHLIWSNMTLDQNKKFPKLYTKKYGALTIPELCKLHLIDPDVLNKYKVGHSEHFMFNTRQVLRNCLDYNIGSYLYDKMEEFHYAKICKENKSEKRTAEIS